MTGEIKEACGVFGVVGLKDSARLTYYGLFALQHRGQESAGIAVAHAGEVVTRKGMGLVGDIFHPGDLEELQGDLAIGHVRYSTTGDSRIENAQPLTVRTHLGPLALGHNGNLVNAGVLREHLEAEGSVFQTTVDTEVLAHLLARSRAERVEDALHEALAECQGAYALVVLTTDRVIGVRDPAGIRPLAIGELDGEYLLASESVAFDAVGARLVRQVEPGEMVQIAPGGRLWHGPRIAPVGPARLCAFEYIYFARPDSELDGINVHAARKRMGRELAREHPTAADLVVGVPDSSTSAAMGYAEEAGLPLEMGLVRNRYVGRTFLRPTAQERAASVHLKLTAIRQVVEGKRVVLVDDSIVRGTTSVHLVRLLREAGAREVHLRISSPAYRNPCFYGIDTSSAGELVATDRSDAEIGAYLGADSIGFLSTEGVARAVGRDTSEHCMACFSGEYPIAVTFAHDKYAFEGKREAGS